MNGDLKQTIQFKRRLTCSSHTFSELMATPSGVGHAGRRRETPRMIPANIRCVAAAACE